MSLCWTPGSSLVRQEDLNTVCDGDALLREGMVPGSSRGGWIVGFPGSSYVPLWLGDCACIGGGSREKEFFKSLVPLGNCRLLDQFGRSTEMGFV